MNVGRGMEMGDQEGKDGEGVSGERGDGLGFVSWEKSQGEEHGGWEPGAPTPMAPR